MSSLFLHPVFECVANPRDVLGCWTTLYQPRSAFGDPWKNCSPWGSALDLDMSAILNGGRTWVMLAPDSGLNCDPQGRATAAVAGNPALCPTEFTFSLWCLPSASALTTNSIIVTRGNTESSSWRMYWGGGRIVVKPANVITNTLFYGTANRWSHIAMTIAGGSLVVYGDGAAVTSASSTLTESLTLNITVGATGTAVNQHFDDVCYTRPMSAGQIRYLYESTRHRFGV